MDLYCSDRKLSELGDGPLGDFLDGDMFTPTSAVSASMDHFGIDSSPMDSTDWLENFFDDPVLNDRMISDALQPNVQSEHSYSLANSTTDEQTMDLSKVKTDPELDMELTAVNPNTVTMPGNSQANSTPILQQTTTLDSSAFIKQEPLDLSLDSTTEATTVTVTRSTNPQTLLKQPTIILATTQQQQLQQQQQQLHTATTTTNPAIKQERLVLPKMSIKLEPQQASTVTTQQQQQHLQTTQLNQQRYTHSLMSSPEHSTESYDNLSLPPTPPSSTNSDSDGCERSPPCSPHRRHRAPSPIIQQPFFMSPIPTSGVLVLTEEEKRTLISEGYPIPTKLPLTKQEEKNLKKIRRKIKNKISAQESRRKKKEYLETLERKVEAYSQENVDLRKKVDNLQNNNQSLMSQLQKLQAIVRNFRPNSPSTTHTGTCLMVVVLCFAVLLGSWSPMSLSLGGVSSSSSVLVPSSPPALLPAAPLGPYPGENTQQKEALPTDHAGAGASGGGSGDKQQTMPKDPIGAYATPNMRSRVLLSHEDETSEEFGPAEPFSYKWLLGDWLGGCSASSQHQPAKTAPPQQPTMPKVNVLESVEINQTGGTAHPDIAVTTTSKPINATA